CSCCSAVWCETRPKGVEDDGRATVPPGPLCAERYDPAMPQYAADLDASDPLAPFRDRFVVEDPDLVYLDGNSLGRAPRRAVEGASAAGPGEGGRARLPQLGPRASGAASSSGHGTTGSTCRCGSATRWRTGSWGPRPGP